MPTSWPSAGKACRSREERTRRGRRLRRTRRRAALGRGGDAVDGAGAGHALGRRPRRRYGRLPIGRLDTRRANAERWLQAHPASPALLLTLARLARAQEQWPLAEDYLHRALAQGAGADAWEELGHGFSLAGDESRARLAYANALRATRGESVVEIPGRDMRQRIHDEAVDRAARRTRDAAAAGVSAASRRARHRTVDLRGASR